jgi:serine/threonine-protein kinase
MDGAGEEGDRDPLLATTLAEKYRIVRVLGGGETGTVYEARTTDGKGVALKVVRPDLRTSEGREAAKRFARGAKASHGIESPYVAQTVDAGADEARGVSYVAMELLNGRDLGRAIGELGPLNADAVVPIFIQACEGLAAAHGLGIVHRNIKPANLFLHETAKGTLVAKVCDFDVAKQITLVEEGSSLTAKGGTLGSPMYMSPEQTLSSKNVDHRSDLWSLGVSLYEALTGEKAWKAKGMSELAVAICTREVQPIRELAPWIDPGLAEVVKKALARKPDDRIASAQDFVAALRPYATLKRVTPDALKAGVEERRRMAAEARSSPGSVSRRGQATSSKGGGGKIALAIAIVVLLAALVGLGVVRSPGSQAPSPPTAPTK